MLKFRYKYLLYTSNSINILCCTIRCWYLAFEKEENGKSQFRILLCGETDSVSQEVRIRVWVSATMQILLQLQYLVILCVLYIIKLS